MKSMGGYYLILSIQYLNSWDQIVLFVFGQLVISEYYLNTQIVVTEYRIVLEFFIRYERFHVDMKIKDKIFLILFGHKIHI